MPEKIICFLPCCKSKSPGLFAPQSVQDDIYSSVISSEFLLKMRIPMHSYIESQSPLTPALMLYTGSFYKQINKSWLWRNLPSLNLRIYIISAGYGIVEAHEQIHDYEAKMEGNIARIWRENGLENVISSILLTERPEKVFGFFAGDSSWSGSTSKYRYFYTEGLKTAIEHGFKPKEAGNFYRDKGLGTTPILASLGKCFMNFAFSGFSDLVLTTAKTEGFRCEEYPSVFIKYDDLGR